MVVQRITHTWRLTSGANVKPDLLSDMHVLIWAFGNATTNDGKVLFLIRSGVWASMNAVLQGFNSP
jgi:hypothetical protein